ncbi:MAG: sigma 54-interacting transcriptional regulator [Bacteroidota bacterium]
METENLIRANTGLIKKGLRILLVEDEFLAGKKLKEMLHQLGYQSVQHKLDFVSATSYIKQYEVDIAFLDIDLHGEPLGIELGMKMGEAEIPFIFLTSYTDDSLIKKVKRCKPSGFIVKPADIQELKAAIEIAIYRNAYSNLSRTEKERQFLLEINSAINFVKDSYLFFTKVANSLKPLFDLDRAPHIAILNKENSHFHIKLDWESDEVDDEFMEGISKFNPIPLTKELQEVMNRDEPTILDVEELKMAFINEDAHNLLDKTGIKCCMIVPLKVNNKPIGYFNIMSGRSDVFGSGHFKLFKAAANQIAVVVQNQLYFEELNELKERAEKENEFLVEEINLSRASEEFIGNSHGINFIKDQIKQVSRTDTSVLIIGETGTGKELVARSIHNSSLYADKPLIKVNCAALPSQLIESELFGHQKGSFTGATAQRIGKFEMANNGIIFLDEIGELPLELQPKLLRVIQEKEIERIGGSEPIKLNVKILAATNRNLNVEVEKGNFRPDLYYRLNVFPIYVSSLRERKEDIKDLAQFFLEKTSRKIGKSGLSLSKASLATMMEYNWPGNIRELQHVIEREVIVTNHNIIDITPDKFSVGNNKVDSGSSVLNSQNLHRTLKEVEKEAVIATLNFTNGKVRGKNGAAELLDINPSTLESRIRKLGINKNNFFN